MQNRHVEPLVLLLEGNSDRVAHMYGKQIFLKIIAVGLMPYSDRITILALHVRTYIWAGI